MKGIIYLLTILFSLGVMAKPWQTEKIVSGLNVPWGMAVIDNQRILVTERHGRLGILNLASSNYRNIFEFPNVSPIGQGGLLDVARSPFADQHYYFTYSRDTGESIETVLAIGKLVNEQIVELKDLFVTQSGASSGRHFGSRIAFDDRYVYFSVGDRGERANGQDLNTHAGSILRLLPDGSIPAGNPFHAPKESANAIWSYGHRNPQGLYYDNGSQQLWSVEHGPRGGDEVNIIEKGSNYGWPITSHGKEYWGPIKVGEAEEMEGIQSPKYVYVPSIAPSSLVVYRGKNYPELNNALLMGSLKFTHINVVHWQQGQPYKEQRIAGELGERVRSLLVTPDDKILFSTDSGNIYYLLPRAE